MGLCRVQDSGGLLSRPAAGGATFKIAVGCLACMIVVPYVMWIVWGGIILDDANGMKDLVHCDADTRWWMQAAGFFFQVKSITLLTVSPLAQPVGSRTH